MKLNYLLTFAFIGLLLFSCSKDEEMETINPIIFNTLESTKKEVFTDEMITIYVDASGYTDIEVISDVSDLVIDNVVGTTYTLNATEAAEATIEVILTNGNFTKSKSLEVSFLEHGVIDFNVVEGFTLDEDSPFRVRELHGDPDYILVNNDTNQEVWYYFDKGFWIVMNNSTNKTDYMRIYGVNWTRTFDDVEYFGKQYPHEISEGLKIENLQLTISSIVDRFGLPSDKSTNPDNDNLHAYNYQDLEAVFFFLSDDIDDIEGKTVGYMNLY